MKQAREELGLTQEDLAARLGVSVRTVSRWEQGSSEPRGPRQKKEIAAVLARSSVGVALVTSLGLSALALGPLGVAVATGLGHWWATRSARAERFRELVEQGASDLGTNRQELLDFLERFTQFCAAERADPAEVVREALEEGGED